MLQTYFFVDKKKFSQFSSYGEISFDFPHKSGTQEEEDAVFSKYFQPRGFSADELNKLEVDAPDRFWVDLYVAIIRISALAL